MRLYIVSTCLWKIWWPTWCHMFNITHRNDFVTRKVSRHPSFSVWTRAWTRLVVDTLRGNMSVKPKDRKLWDKLYTDTSSHEKICMRTRPCKSKSCAEGRFFTMNTHHSPSRGSNHWSLTWFRMWTVAYIHVLQCENLHQPGDVLVSQNSAEKRLLVKNCTLSRLTVDTTYRDMSH